MEQLIRPRKQLALVGRDIASDLPLDQLPLMKQVAETCARAFERGCDRLRRGPVFRHPWGPRHGVAPVGALPAYTLMRWTAPAPGIADAVACDAEDRIEVMVRLEERCRHDAEQLNPTASSSALPGPMARHLAVRR